MTCSHTMHNTSAHIPSFSSDHKGPMLARPKLSVCLPCHPLCLPRALYSRGIGAGMPSTLAAGSLPGQSKALEQSSSVLPQPRQHLGCWSSGMLCGADPESVSSEGGFSYSCAAATLLISTRSPRESREVRMPPRRKAVLCVSASLPLEIIIPVWLYNKW